MSQLFQLFFYQPVLNLFVGLYDIVPDVGVVILLITIIIKAILWPLTGKGIAAQKSLQDLQPKLEEAKVKYKDEPQVLAQETLKLYKEHKVNPFGSCLPILVQIPVFLALFYVLKDELGGDISGELYSFVPRPEQINSLTFGFFDLAKPHVVLAILAGLAQWYQAKSMITRRVKPPVKSGAKDEDMMAMMNKQMMYMLPVMTVLISFSLPGGVALYWFFSTVITIIQQNILFKKSEASTSSIIEGEIVEK